MNLMIKKKRQQQASSRPCCVYVVIRLRFLFCPFENNRIVWEAI